MPTDKSLFYYGRPYHRFIDSISALQREAVVELIAEGASVLDVGCGTGELALALRERKGCRVVGIDLSLRMIDYARSRNPYPEVTFLHRDATNLSDLEGGPFGYGVLCMVLHELRSDLRAPALGEVRRLAERVVLLDHGAPPPRNVAAAVSRLIEATIGRDHWGNYQDFLRSGGIMSLLDRQGLASRVVSRLEINGGCHQVVVLG